MGFSLFQFAGLSVSREWVAPLQSVLATLVVVVFLRRSFLRRGQLKLPPGPRPWPVLGNLLQIGEYPHRRMLEFTKEYGPLVYLRLGSVPTVVTSCPEIAREFLKDQDHVFCSRPKLAQCEYVAGNGAGLAMSPYGAHWRDMRKLCVQELLAPNRIELYRKERTEEAQDMVRTVFQACKQGHAIHMREKIESFVTNVISRMLFGTRYFGGSAASEISAVFIDILHEAFFLLGVFNIGDYVPLLRALDCQGYVRQMKRLQKKMKATMSVVIRDHRQKGRKETAECHDFVDVLLSLPGENGEPHLSDATTEALLFDMIAAASDTSSVTMEWALAELVRHPEVQRKVQDEIDHCCGRERVVDESDIHQFQYLKAVLKETFRLHPAGSFLLPRMSMEACKIAGYDIPKHTTVLINVFGLGRNPAVFERPEEFRPERWIDGSKSVDLRDPAEFRVLPFGAGRRGCPGSSLGQCFVMVSLSRLLQAFDWSLPAGSSDIDMTEGKGMTMPMATRLKVVANPRLPLHLY